MHILLVTTAGDNTTAGPTANVTTVAPPVIPASFLRFGFDAGDSVVPPADDGSSEEIRLNTDFVFFGRSETVVFVSNIAIDIILCTVKHTHTRMHTHRLTLMEICHLARLTPLLVHKPSLPFLHLS